ncbi:uncharacterized protein LOC126879012 [Diabrotica virgifera virgifera]|uniref:Uncharacterized protein n=1 Tax=Diabrotica virgifera virgifera TaxID=50390 RepID=A0ABM5JIT2_DIAVI|nr:uncharacterized protein LOC126879012 [Diabrotica virgifera virgifera]
MKSFVVLLVIYLQVWAGDTYSDLGQAIQECGAGRGGANEVKEPMDLQKHGATIFCMLNKGEIVNENGDMIENNVREIYYRKMSATEKEVDAVIQKCGTKNGKTREEVAFNLFICLQARPSETKKP